MESIFAYIGNIVWYLNFGQAAASAEGILADRCNSWRYSNVLLTTAIFKGIIAYLFKIIGHFCGRQVSAAHKREVVVLI